MITLQNLGEKCSFVLPSRDVAQLWFESVEHAIKHESNYELTLAPLLSHHKRNEYGLKIKKNKSKELEAKIEEMKRYLIRLSQYRETLIEDVRLEENLQEDPDDIDNDNLSVRTGKLSNCSEGEEDSTKDEFSIRQSQP